MIKRRKVYLSLIMMGNMVLVADFSFVFNITSKIVLFYIINVALIQHMLRNSNLVLLPWYYNFTSN